MEIKLMKIVKEITATFLEEPQGNCKKCEISTNVESGTVTISIVQKDNINGECIMFDKSEFDAFVQEYIKTYNITAYATL